MIVNSSHRIWFAATLTATAIFTVVYVAAVWRDPDGPRGGGWLGISFGALGSLLMVLAGLLSARKKLPGWSFGPASLWLKGHLWLGLLSVPCILFHCGFRWGGRWEQLLLLVFAVVIVSGIVGLALQQWLPSVMRAQIPAEAMRLQLPHVKRKLRDLAESLLDKSHVPLLGLAARDAVGDAALVAAFFRETIWPYLNDRAPGYRQLGNVTRAASLFAQVREQVGDELRPTLDKLSAICEEKRQLDRQSRLHGWLHGWLMLHVPLSLALLVLGIIHVLTAMMPTWPR